MAPFILVTGSTTSAMAKVLCPNYSYLGMGHLVKAVTHLCIIRKASMISAIESCEMQFSAQLGKYHIFNCSSTHFASSSQCWHSMRKIFCR